MVKYLHIKLLEIELLHGNGMQQSYYSILYENVQYFSSEFDAQNYKLINDDIVIRIPSGVSIPDHIFLQRWENHMIIFYHQIEMPQFQNHLNTDVHPTNKIYTKKKIETKKNQLLTFGLYIYDESQIMITENYISSISQHYLFLEAPYVDSQKNMQRVSNLPSYFSIDTSSARFILPVRNASIIIKLPETLEFSSYKNNNFHGKSKMFEFTQLEKNRDGINLYNSGSFRQTLHFTLKYGINLHKNQKEKIIMDTNQILLYDFQIKFDNPSEVIGSKLKIWYGAKVFQFSEELNINKITKIKKIIFFIIKSEEEDIQMIIERNGKNYCSIKFSTGEFKSFCVNTLKKKWMLINLSNGESKCIGSIKLKGEKSKTVSIPQNNKKWRQFLKRKLSSNSASLTLFISQVSVYYHENEHLTFVVKGDNEEKSIEKVVNLNYFQNQDDIFHEDLQLTIKLQENVYFLVKPEKGQQHQNNFHGISMVNPSELKLGMNVCEIAIFKNQERTGTINCLINKMIGWPFMKGMFQQKQLSITPSLPPSIHQSHTANSQPQIQKLLAIFINKIEFTEYLYTYAYENKHEVYCIAEIHKAKKVLILQKMTHNQLHFTPGLQSDLLEFPSSSTPDYLNIESNNQESVKLKMTFLVSDLGHEEQIYGSSTQKINVFELFDKSSKEKQLKFKGIKIWNDYGVNIGEVTLQVSVVERMKQQGDYESIRKSILELKHKETFDLSQASFDTQHKIVSKDKNIFLEKSPSRRYSGGVTTKNKNEKVISNKIQSRDFVTKNSSTQQDREKERDMHLPMIRESTKNKDNFKDLFQLMKVRKRMHGGQYEENRLSDKQELELKKERQNHSINISSSHKEDFDYSKIQKNNPNLNRNLQILFPKKVLEKYQSKLDSDRQSAKKIKENQYYTEKLKGLKSVMNEISRDISEVSPTIRESREGREKRYSIENEKNGEIEEEKEEYRFEKEDEEKRDREWEGNQFL